MMQLIKKHGKRNVEKRRFQQQRAEKLIWNRINYDISENHDKNFGGGGPAVVPWSQAYMINNRQFTRKSQTHPPTSDIDQFKRTRR